MSSWVGSIFVPTKYEYFQQENAIVEDLLYVLTGIEGQYILVEPLDTPFGQRRFKQIVRYKLICELLLSLILSESASIFIVRLRYIMFLVYMYSRTVSCFAT